MKQKYLLEKQEDNSLKIREYGELEEKSFSLMCEVVFDFESLEENLDQDISELVDVLRTDNMFPPKIYAEKIAEAVKAMYAGNLDSNPFEIIFDDMDFVARDEYEEEVEEAEEELIDDLLDEEENFDPLDDKIVDIDPDRKGSIKVDDTDIDEDL